MKELLPSSKAWRIDGFTTFAHAWELVGWGETKPAAEAKLERRAVDGQVGIIGNSSEPGVGLRLGDGLEALLLCWRRPGYEFMGCERGKNVGEG